MQRPFEVESDYLSTHLDELITTTFSDLQSQFLLLPKGGNFVEYGDFQDAYETLKRYTNAFSQVNTTTIWSALRENSLSLVVLRTILGMTPPEWADLARSDRVSKSRKASPAL